MKRDQRNEVRYFAFLSAFCCSMFFSGCGNGSDGTATQAELATSNKANESAQNYAAADALDNCTISRSSAAVIRENALNKLAGVSDTIDGIKVEKSHKDCLLSALSQNGQGRVGDSID